MKQEPERLGVFVILIQNNRVLLGKRKNAYKSSFYGFPGGRLKLTESLIDSAKRELLEEIGVEAIDLKYIGVIRELQEGYNFIHFGFVCNKYIGDIRTMEPDKCEGWEFYSPDQLPTKTLPAHIAGSKLLKSKLSTYVDLI